MKPLRLCSNQRKDGFVTQIVKCHTNNVVAQYTLERLYGDTNARSGHGIVTVLKEKTERSLRKLPFRFKDL